MKKLLFFASALAGLFLAASCQRENLEPVGGNTVTYTVQVPGKLSTKAIGTDVAAVTELIYEVYRIDEQGTETKLYQKSQTRDAANGETNWTVELELVNNQDFRVLFWAQVPENGVYTTTSLKNVTLATGLNANAENYAAFAGQDEITYGENLAGRTVTLERPVAQLNIATSAESLKLGEDENGENAQTTVKFETTAVTVEGLSTVYNVAEGAAGADEATFTYAAKPVALSETTLNVNGVDYAYVAMNYVGFAQPTGDNVTVTYTINTENVGTITNKISSVPVKANHRTNIIGNLITSTSDYTVTLDAAWPAEEENVEVVAVSTAADLQDAINNISDGAEGNVKLEGNIDLGDLAGLVSTKADAPTYGLLIPAGKALVLDLNGCTLSQTVEQTAGYSMILNKGTLTIDDSKGNGKISYTDSKVYAADNGYVSNTITNNGTLIIKGGIIENNSADNVAQYGYPYAIDSMAGSDGNDVVTNIEGGTIQSNYSPLGVRPNSADKKVVANITGGNIKGRIDFQMLSTTPVFGELNISGGSFDKYGIKNYVLLVFGAGEGTDASGMKANITGGTFNAGFSFSTALPIGSNFNKKFISGGEFSFDPSEYVANGYVAKQNENNLWTIVPAPAVVEGGYEISNAAQLKYFAESVNAGETTYNGATIKLAADIDLQNEPWTPIGFNSNSVAGSEKYFTGTFDGQNHTIRNLKIDVKDQGGVGLFGTVHNASFKNFTLENVDIKAVESEDDPANTSGAENHSNYIVGGHTGAVVGYDAKAGEVNFENVHVKGLVRIEGETRAAQGQRIGGIIGGRGSSKMTFKNVSVKGTDGSYIKGYCSTAGVSGQIQNVATYENVHTDIDVYAVTFGAGGIAGIVRQGSTFTNCSSAGDITLDASKTQLSSYSANYPYRVGGIAGCWSESATGVLTLTDCTYTGKLTSIDRDENTPQTLDYAGYVGRGYALNGCAGSKVVINGVEYVQAYNTAAEAGIYIVDGVLEIASAAALRTLATNVNNGKTFEGQTVRLADDIDLNNEEWIPIGSATADHGFMGNFDGNSKTIRNLKMTKLTTDSDNYVYAGLFGVTEGTESQENYIKDLVIENVTIETSGHIAAAAIAYPYYTTVENITVKGNINITGGDYTSGVLAYTRRCVNAKNLAIEGNTGSSITGNQTVGGVISDIQMNGGLKANYSNFKASGLTITAAKSVGGISGIISGQTLDGATVENVSLVSDDVRTGIIAGSLGSKSTIKNIKVTNVTGADKVVGATYDGGLEVTVNGDEYGE